MKHFPCLQTGFLSPTHVEATVGFQSLIFNENEDVGSFQACVVIRSTTNNVALNRAVQTVVSTVSNTATGTTT